jgi:hypothetical protein
MRIAIVNSLSSFADETNVARNEGHRKAKYDKKVSKIAHASRNISPFQK